MIEALTYRLSDHTTADDAQRYRPAAEVQQAWVAEPLKRMRNYLTSRGVWDAAREEALKNDCTLQVEAAVESYLKTALPSTDAMFDHLFAHLPQRVREQRDIARRYARPSAH